MSNQTSASEWLTASEAARYLRVRVRTLLLWARQGRVKAYALSGTKRHVWRFRASDLDAVLVGQPNSPSETDPQELHGKAGRAAAFDDTLGQPEPKEPACSSAKGD
jgi:excisionase family DNA binding protein